MERNMDQVSLDSKMGQCTKDIGKMMLKPELLFTSQKLVQVQQANGIPQLEVLSIKANWWHKINNINFINV